MTGAGLDDDLLGELCSPTPRGRQSMCSVSVWLDGQPPEIVETLAEAVRRGASWTMLEDRLKARGLDPPASNTLARHYKGRCKCPTTT